MLFKLALGDVMRKACVNILDTNPNEFDQFFYLSSLTNDVYIIEGTAAEVAEA